MIDVAASRTAQTLVCRAFVAMWDALAETSHCDARGGMEYHRVRAMVLNGQLTEHMVEWIAAQVNAGAAGSTVQTQAAAAADETHDTAAEAAVQNH